VVSSRGVAVVLLAFLIAGPAFGAELSLTHLYPVAAQQGTTITVAAAGKVEPWPPQVWIDTPGITFSPTPITGIFNVEIAPDAAPGPHLVRLFNEQGASAPCFFIVSRQPELRDAEPNDDFKLPQQVAALPATISGRLDKTGDVECFAVALKQGQTLVAWVEAYVLGSNCDALLRIVDSAGRVLSFNHDGRNLDPFLAWKAPRDGTFIVQLMAFAYPAGSSVQFTGGEGCVYRLHLTSGPFVRFTLPLAARSGTKSALRLVGWNLPGGEAELDANQMCAGSAVAPALWAGIEWMQPLTISALAETMEHEPNDVTNTAQTVDVPSAVTGQVNPAGDEDRFVFTAAKQRAYDFQLTGARVGSPLDAWLRIEDATGKELAHNDDAAGSRDPRLTWIAPSDGTFTVAIGDVTHRGGDDFVYRLTIAAAEPSVRATTATHAVSIEPGKTAELKVAAKRTSGFARKLQLVAKNLPDGVSASPVEVPEKDGEITLKLAAEPTAAPAGRPFALVLQEIETGHEHRVRYPMVATSEDNGVPQGYSELVIEFCEQPWITVTTGTVK
jgi:hypothetical protein